MKIRKGTSNDTSPESIYVTDALRFDVDGFVALNTSTGDGALKVISEGDKVYAMDTSSSHSFLAQRIVTRGTTAYSNTQVTFNCCQSPTSLPTNWLAKSDYDSALVATLSKFPLSVKFYINLLLVLEAKWVDSIATDFLAGTTPLNYPGVVMQGSIGEQLIESGNVWAVNDAFSIGLTYTTTNQPVTLTLSDSAPDGATLIDIRGVVTL